MDEAVVVSSAELASDAQAAADLKARVRALNYRVRNTRDYIRETNARAEALKEQLDGMEGPAPIKLVSQYEDLLEELETSRTYVYGVIAEATNWRYSPEQVRGWYKRAEEMGCVRPSAGENLVEDLLYVRKVPNVIFRERVLELRGNGHVIPEIDPIAYPALGNETLDRLVGLNYRTDHRPGRGKSLRLYVTYEQGVELARMLGIPPHAAGV